MHPSSLHGVGIAAEKIVKKSRDTIAGVMGVSAADIYFTSGGTASDNIAIFGGAKSGVGSHLVTTAIEHDAVLGCFKALQPCHPG